MRPMWTRWTALIALGAFVLLGASGIDHQGSRSDVGFDHYQYVLGLEPDLLGDGLPTLLEVGRLLEAAPLAVTTLRSSPTAPRGPPA